jgi:hypothetical protein
LVASEMVTSKSYYIGWWFISVLTVNLIECISVLIMFF